jgi:hypothetical protein
MFERASISAVASCAVLAALLSIPLGVAKAFDDAKYPNLKGQWLAAREAGHGPAVPSICKVVNWQGSMSACAQKTRYSIVNEQEKQRCGHSSRERVFSQA